MSQEDGTRMTSSDEPCEHAHGATGSPRQPGRMFAPGLSRRRFLQYTGLGAAAAAAAGISGGPAAAAVAGRTTASKGLPKGWTGTIADVKHVVILMQENRSFDHYFGTLRGVRGFGDKQILTYPNGDNIFQQPDPARTDLGYLLPYNLTDQVDGDLDHSWTGDHEARNGSLWNNWVPAKTEETMGYFYLGRDPVQVRGCRRLHHLRRRHHQGDHGSHQPQPDVLLDRHVERLDQQPERLRGRLRARRRDVRGHHLSRAAAGRRGQLAGVHQQPGRGQRQLPRLLPRRLRRQPALVLPAVQHHQRPQRRDRPARHPRRGHPVEDRRGGAAAEQDPCRLRAVDVHQGCQQQRPHRGVVDRRPGRLLRAPLLHPRLRGPLRQHRAADAVLQPRPVED